MRGLNWFERWILRRILRKVVCNHQLPSLFLWVRQESRNTWFEDNDVTVEDYIIECFLSQKAKYFRLPKDTRKFLLERHHEHG